MLKRIWPFAALILLAIGIYFATYTPPVKILVACDKSENCIDLYGKPSIAIAMGVEHMWGAGRVEDPSGHCRNGCTVKMIYDQVGDNNLTQVDSTKRPDYCNGVVCLTP